MTKGIFRSNTLTKDKWVISNLLTDIFVDEMDMEGLEKFFIKSTWKIVSKYHRAGRTISVGIGQIKDKYLD
ncbi:hypothetical protein BpHYR1_017676 [Brachionus plicatilis]|uniref:Uncharacterized protein n=1 Tax=Brachionus plicatilis TaxID=10195 RepID=A0A3M7QRK7_BRAPC|nr:hypothetical protein BpHYR1_017676 [Brachionus plicatilis]